MAKRMRCIIAILSFSFLVFACKSFHRQKDADAEFENPRMSVSSEVAKFIIEMSDSRMLDYAEGELAMKRSRMKAIREYGEKMMGEQMVLYRELHELAQANDVDLSEKMSRESQDSLEELRKQKAQDFEKQFVIMIRKNHLADIHAFRKLHGSRKFSGDRSVEQFAKKRLPMIQSHLLELKAFHFKK